MNKAGITRRMMGFAEAMTGHWRGGLAQINVLLSTLLGGVAGSANADAAMQSKMLVPEMGRRGYDLGFSSAVTACSAIISVIIPPGIGLVLYGFMGDVSIGQLFLAGIVPGFFLCAAMMGAVALHARRNNLKPALDRRLSRAERLTRMCGYGQAMRLLLTGARFGAEEACRLGMIEWLVEDSSELEVARGVAATIADHSTIATQAVKAAVRSALDMTVARGLQYENELMSLCFAKVRQEESRKRHDRRI